ncbi:MAG: hypothetical protein K8U57_31630 [Planctomycetes bacterium]|nr:hypothetical protein [Planctomycetota bacterium]
MSAIDTSGDYANAVVALATAMLSVLVPHSTPIARQRLAAVTTMIADSKWSDATISALARKYTDWLAIAHLLQGSIPSLQAMEHADLFCRLCEAMCPGIGRIAVNTGHNESSALCLWVRPSMRNDPHLNSPTQVRLCPTRWRAWAQQD